MNSNQLLYIENPKIENTVLIACPGSGKTTCVLARINYLISNMNIFPDQILFSSFNKFTVDDARRRFNCSEYNVQFNTIDSLCWHILNKIDPKLSKDIPILQEIIQNISDKDFISGMKKIKIIFIDEAQDLNDLNWIFIKRYAKLNDATLNLIGDVNQAIYQFRGSTSYHLETFDANKFILDINYRSSSAIVELANIIMPIKDQYKKMKSAKENIACTIPEFHHWRYGQEDIFFAKIKELFIKSSKKGETVCIASPFHGKNDFEGLAYITNTLYRYGIPFKTYYDESSEQDFKMRKQFRNETNEVLVFTYHGLKGLEFDHTIIFDTYHDLIGHPVTHDEDSYNKYLLFVALTRAKKTLWIYNFKYKNLNNLIIDLINYGNNIIKINGFPFIEKSNRYMLGIGMPTTVTNFINHINCHPEKMGNLITLLKDKCKIKLIKDFNFDKKISALNDNNAFNGIFLEVYFANKYYNKRQLLSHLHKKIVKYCDPYAVKYFNTEMKIMSLGYIDDMINYINSLHDVSQEEIKKEKNKYHYNIIVKIKKLLNDKYPNIPYENITMIYENKLETKNIIDIELIDEIIKKYNIGTDLKSLFNAILADYAIKIFHYYLIKKPDNKIDIMEEKKLFIDIDNMMIYIKQLFPKLKYQVINRAIFTGSQNRPLRLNGIMDFYDDNNIIEIKTYDYETVQFNTIIQLLLYSNIDITKKFYMINLRNGKIFQLLFDKFDRIALIDELIKCL